VCHVNQWDRQAGGSGCGSTAQRGDVGDKTQASSADCAASNRPPTASSFSGCSACRPHDVDDDDDDDDARRARIIVVSCALMAVLGLLAAEAAG